MSLKAFHIIFIIASIILIFYFAGWSLSWYKTLNKLGYLVSACFSFLLAIGLIVYEINFISKFKNKS